MTGVEILATQEVVTETTCNWWLAGIVFLAVVILGGIFGFCISDYIDRGLAVIMGCFLGALIGLMAWAFIGVISIKPVAYETQYKITISDEVPMNDFLERYEIVDQDGKIYTVKERD